MTHCCVKAGQEAVSPGDPPSPTLRATSRSLLKKFTAGVPVEDGLAVKLFEAALVGVDVRGTVADDIAEVDGLPLLLSLAVPLLDAVFDAVAVFLQCK